MSRTLRITWNFVRVIVGVILEILGLAGAPSDAAQWNEWMRELLPWIQDPLFFVPMIWLGSILICWVVAEVYAQRRIEEVLTILPRGHDADMTLKELVFYLKDKAKWSLEFSNFDDWAEATMLAIEDQFRMSRLAVWGRSEKDLLTDFQSTLEQIGGQIWEGSTIDLTTIFEPDEKVLARTFATTKGIFYDLRVNKRQIEVHWTKMNVFVRQIAKLRKWPRI